MTIDHNLLYAITQLVIVVWMFSGLNQRVKELEKDSQEGKISHKEIRDELHRLSLVVARSDEKLVQLLMGNTYVNTAANSVPRPKRRKGQNAEPV